MSQCSGELKKTLQAALGLYNYVSKHGLRPTVLPAKSESDITFCLQSYQGLIIVRLEKTQTITAPSKRGSLQVSVYQDRINTQVIYPVDRINTQLIYQFGLAQMECSS